MKLTEQEKDYVRAKGLYLTEKCDGCGKALNQTFRYTILRKPEFYCSALCRDTAFFGSLEAGKRHTTPGKCARCGASLANKRRGALYCSHLCKVQDDRETQIICHSDIIESVAYKP